MAKAQAQPDLPTPPATVPAAAPSANEGITGFASRVHELPHEAAFLRSLFSRPTSEMDPYSNTIFPFGDDRAIMPTSNDVRGGANPKEPKDRFPAVAWTDGPANDARDYLRDLIARERGMPAGTAFTNYETRLALTRIPSTGVAFTPEFVAEAYGDAEDSYTALTDLIERLWNTEDSLCRRLTQPIPAPPAPMEV